MEPVAKVQPEGDCYLSFILVPRESGDHLPSNRAWLLVSGGCFGCNVKAVVILKFGRYIFSKWSCVQRGAEKCYIGSDLDQAGGVACPWIQLVEETPLG